MLQKIACDEIKKLKPYTGTKDYQSIHDYYKRLEHLINTGFDRPSCKEEDNILKLSILLTKTADPARSFLDNTLTPGKRTDVKVMIDELQKRFEYGQNEVFYKNQISNVPDNGQIPFIELVSRVEYLTKRIILASKKGISENSTEYELLFETMAKNTIESKMNQRNLRQIKVQVEELSYKKLKELGARMDSFYAPNKTTRSLEQNNFRPKKNEPRSQRKCEHCSKPGHTSENCWGKHPEMMPKPKNAEAICKFCKGKGHITDECRKMARQAELVSQRRRSFFCQYCKKNGHTEKYCRIKATNDKGNEKKKDK